MSNFQKTMEIVNSEVPLISDNLNETYKNKDKLDHLFQFEKTLVKKANKISDKSISKNVSDHLNKNEILSVSDENINNSIIPIADRNHHNMENSTFDWITNHYKIKKIKDELIKKFSKIASLEKKNKKDDRLKEFEKIGIENHTENSKYQEKKTFNLKQGSSLNLKNNKKSNSYYFTNKNCISNLSSSSNVKISSNEFNNSSLCKIFQVNKKKHFNSFIVKTRKTFRMKNSNEASETNSINNYSDRINSEKKNTLKENQFSIIEKTLTNNLNKHGLNRKQRINKSETKLPLDFHLTQKSYLGEVMNNPLNISEKIINYRNYSESEIKRKSLKSNLNKRGVPYANLEDNSKTSNFELEILTNREKSNLPILVDLNKKRRSLYKKKQTLQNSQAKSKLKDILNSELTKIFNFSPKKFLNPIDNRYNKNSSNEISDISEFSINYDNNKQENISEDKIYKFSKNVNTETNCNNIYKSRNYLKRNSDNINLKNAMFINYKNENNKNINNFNDINNFADRLCNSKTTSNVNVKNNPKNFKLVNEKRSSCNSENLKSLKIRKFSNVINNNGEENISKSNNNIDGIKTRRNTYNFKNGGKSSINKNKKKEETLVNEIERSQNFQNKKSDYIDNINDNLIIKENIYKKDIFYSDLENLNKIKTKEIYNYLKKKDSIDLNLNKQSLSFINNISRTLSNEKNIKNINLLKENRIKQESSDSKQFYDKKTNIEKFEDIDSEVKIKNQFNDYSCNLSNQDYLLKQKSQKDFLCDEESKNLENSKMENEKSKDEHNYENKRIIRRTKNSVYDSLSENEDKKNFRINNKFFLDPNSKTKLVIDFLSFLVASYSVIFLPLKLIFFDQITFLYVVFQFLCDAVYLVDFVSGFFLAYYDFEENFLTSLENTITNYMRSFFFLDLFAALPFNTIFQIIKYLDFLENNENINSLNKQINYDNLHNMDSQIYLNNNKIINNNFINLKLNTKNVIDYLIIQNDFSRDYHYLIFLNLGKINRIFIFFRLLKIFKIASTNEFINFINNSIIANFSYFQTYLKIFSYYIYFFLISHVLSCTFIFLGTVDFPNWINNAGLQDDSFMKIYLASLYFNHTTIFTVGYGDILSKNIYEKTYNIVLMIVGIMLYSFALTSISNMIKMNDENVKNFEKKREYLDYISRKYAINKTLYDNLNRFLFYEMKTDKTNKFDLLNELPITLRNEMILNMHKKEIENFKFFKKIYDHDFIIQVILTLKPTNSVRNDILIKQGDFIEEIIFIKYGILQLETVINLEAETSLVSPQMKNYIQKNSENNQLIEPSIEHINTYTNNQILNKNIKSNNLENVIKNYDKLKENPEENNKKDENYKFKEKKKKISQIKDLKSKGKKSEFINKSTIIEKIKILDLRKNEHFGDALMIENERSPLTLRTKTKSAELFLMNKIDVMKISDLFSEIFEQIYIKSSYNFSQIIRLAEVQRLKSIKKSKLRIYEKIQKNREKSTSIIDLSKKDNSNNLFKFNSNYPSKLSSSKKNLTTMEKKKVNFEKMEENNIIKSNSKKTKNKNSKNNLNGSYYFSIISNDILLENEDNENNKLNILNSNDKALSNNFDEFSKKSLISMINYSKINEEKDANGDVEEKSNSKSDYDLSIKAIPLKSPYDKCNSLSMNSNANEKIFLEMANLINKNLNELNNADHLKDEVEKSNSRKSDSIFKNAEEKRGMIFKKLRNESRSNLKKNYSYKNTKNSNNIYMNYLDEDQIAYKKKFEEDKCINNNTHRYKRRNDLLPDENLQEDINKIISVRASTEKKNNHFAMDEKDCFDKDKQGKIHKKYYENKNESFDEIPDEKNEFTLRNIVKHNDIKSIVTRSFKNYNPFIDNNSNKFNKTEKTNFSDKISSGQTNENFKYKENIKNFTILTNNKEKSKTISQKEKTFEDKINLQEYYDLNKYSANTIGNKNDIQNLIEYPLNFIEKGDNETLREKKQNILDLENKIIYNDVKFLNTSKFQKDNLNGLYNIDESKLYYNDIKNVNCNHTKSNSFFKIEQKFLFDNNLFEKGDKFPTLIQDEMIPLGNFYDNITFCKILEQVEKEKLVNLCENCNLEISKRILNIRSSINSLNSNNKTNLGLSVEYVDSILILAEKQNYVNYNKLNKWKNKRIENSYSEADEIHSGNSSIEKRRKSYLSIKNNNKSYQNCNFNKSIKIKNIQITNIDGSNKGSLINNINQALENVDLNVGNDESINYDELKNYRRLNCEKLKISDKMPNHRNKERDDDEDVISTKAKMNDFINKNIKSVNNRKPNKNLNIFDQDSFDKKSKTNKTNKNIFSKNYLLSPLIPFKSRNENLHIDNVWQEFKKMGSIQNINETLFNDLKKIKNILSKENESENEFENNSNLNNLFNSSAGNISNLINNPISNLRKNSVFNKFRKSKISTLNDLVKSNTESDKLNKLKNLINSNYLYSNQFKKKNNLSIGFNERKRFKQNGYISNGRKEKYRETCKSSRSSKLKESKLNQENLKNKTNFNNNLEIESNYSNEALVSDWNVKHQTNINSSKIKLINHNEDSLFKGILDKGSNLKSKRKSKEIIQTKNSFENINNKLDNILKMLKNDHI